jgi:hypothetical protein
VIYSWRAPRRVIRLGVAVSGTTCVLAFRLPNEWGRRSGSDIVIGLTRLQGGIHGTLR